MKTTRWHDKANADNIPEFKSALLQMSPPQLSFYANALKAAARHEAHKLVLEEISRRVVLAYVEEGLGG
jgi:hypothetical protein